MDRLNEVTKELDRLLEYALLYDFYGGLLKENHRQMFEDYMLNDLSLGEIAKEWGISRQGVYDVIKRSVRKLKEYEDKLGLMNKFNETSDKVKEIQYWIQEIKRTGNMEHLEKIERFTYDILD